MKSKACENHSAMSYKPPQYGSYNNMVKPDGQDMYYISGVLLFVSTVSPVKSADQNLTGETHPSPELETAVTHFSGQTAPLQFGHGGQLGDIITFNVQCCKGRGKKRKERSSEKRIPATDPEECGKGKTRTTKKCGSVSQSPVVGFDSVFSPFTSFFSAQRIK